MEQKQFKESGVGSIAWYLQAFKENPDRRGYTYIRKEYKGAPQADVLKECVNYLVNARYLNKQSKPDQPKQDRYTVTSFGHRYLSEHTTVEDFNAGVDAPEAPSVPEQIAAAQGRIDTKNAEIGNAAANLKADGDRAKSAPVEKVSDLLGKTFHPEKTPVFKSGFLPGGEPVGEREIDLAEDEIEENAPPDRVPWAAPLAKALDEVEPGDEDNGLFDDVLPGEPVPVAQTQSFAEALITTTKDLLFDRHSGDVSVKEVIAYLEKK